MNPAEGSAPAAPRPEDAARGDVSTASPATDSRAGLDEAWRLLDFATGALVESGGFGFLDVHGHFEGDRPLESFVTARMTYSFSIGTLLGYPDSARFAAHGVDALAGMFRDHRNGGYVVDLGPDARGRRKAAYQHAFVVLAASAAASAGIRGGDELLDDVLGVVEEHFWSEADAALVEEWDEEFTVREDYWGSNANMHGVECLLAAYAYTRDERWRDRAAMIAGHFIDRRARRAGWLLPEHYASDWSELRDYNRDRPADEFRPYGVTVGHLFEWSRLMVELASTYDEPPPWMEEAAAELYEKAVAVGWAADGNPGFVYTVDWDGVPVVRQRPHWVVAEAIAAAGTWHRRTGRLAFADDLDRWYDYAERHLVDRVGGSWHHELDPLNRPAWTMWSGKPDVYHALHAALLPVLPVAESTARRIMLSKG